MTGRNAIIVLITMLVTFLGSDASAQQPGNSVTATVQPAQVSVGDSVKYQVSIVLSGSGQPSVAVPVFDPDTGLSAPAPAGTQSSLETYIVNGNFRSVQRITYGYTIRTSKVGTFTIPPATVTLNGKTYETKPVQLEVRPVPKATNVPTELEGLVVAPKVPGNPELQRKLTGVVFILPVISSTEPFNGEQVRISYHLVIDLKALTKAGLLPQTNLDGVSIPPLNEFLAEELYPFPQDLKFQEREIGGNLYLVAPVYEAVITSTKTGKLQIEPFQISMLFSLKSQGSGRQTPFSNDPFFSSLGPFSMMAGNSVQVIAESPVLTLDVKPIPQQGRPPDFGGAVGNFEIRAEVDKTTAKAYDETISLDVTVEGQGNTESLSPPELPPMKGFTILGQPDVATTGRKDGEDYISIKKFSYTLRPTTAGNQTIPPIQMSYFEPGEKEFVTVDSEPIPLTITPGSRPAPVMTLPDPEPQEDEPVDQAEPDLRYISTESLSSPTSFLDIFRGVSGIVMFLVPPGILLAAGLVAWRRERAHHQAVDLRKMTGAVSSKHIKEAHRALNAGHTKEMAAELAIGMRAFFASRFGITIAEATIPEIEDRLTRSGAPAELVGGISQVLESCDSAQYSPAPASQSSASGIYHEAVRLLNAAEEYV